MVWVPSISARASTLALKRSSIGSLDLFAHTKIIIIYLHSKLFYSGLSGSMRTVQPDCKSGRLHFRQIANLPVRDEYEKSPKRLYRYNLSSDFEDRAYSRSRYSLTSDAAGFTATIVPVLSTRTVIPPPLPAPYFCQIRPASSNSTRFSHG